jgi:hypothetical protein
MRRIARLGYKKSNMELEEPKIETLGLSVFEVYRALHWKLGSEDKVLEKYPGLNRQDLASVEAYVINGIRSRTHDDLTGRSMLPKSELRNGAYYKGRRRHATVARWNDAKQSFYHWREKFGNIYIETIKYPTGEDEPWWDVFFVVEELKTTKFAIPFDDDATFEGDPFDLAEFQEEMWRGSNKHPLASYGVAESSRHQNE